MNNKELEDFNNQFKEEMIVGRMTIDEAITHTLFEYKGNKYSVIRKIKIKSPLPGRWFEGVLYRQFYDGNEAVFYARPFEDFISKFKPI